MGSIRIGENGQYEVNGGRTNVNTDRAASQTFHHGGGNTATWNIDGTDYSVSFDADAGGGSRIPYRAPVGTVGGTTYYDSSDYAQAMQSARNSQRATNLGFKSGIDERQGIKAAVPTTMAAQAGLEQIPGDQVKKQDASNDKTPKAQKKQVSSVPSVSIDTVEETVADSDQDFNEQPQTASENLGYVDTDTGVIESLTPGREKVKSGVRKKRRKSDRLRKAAPESKISSYIKRMDEEAADGTKTYYVPPAAFDMIDTHDNLVLKDALANWREPTKQEIANAKAQKDWYRKKQGVRNIFDSVSDAREDRYQQRRNAVSESFKADNLRNIEGRLSGMDDSGYGNGEYVDLGNLSDYGKDLSDEKAQEKLRKRLQETQEARSKPLYEAIAETSDNVRGKGLEDSTHGQRPWSKGEKSILKDLARARDEIKSRLLNPMKLRIQSEHIEIRTEKHGKNTTVKGRMRYSEVVENAIHNVKDVYRCSTRDVMALVQLRAGLGVSLKGRIGGKKSSKFVMSDAQFEEICKDIIESQRLYGHPMGLINGAPGLQDVRDDSGKFVVIAGTRCFPMGYVPRYLLANLSVNENSALYGIPIGQTQTKIGESWINDTYPNLMANTDGNLLWQARAIENMMRAVVSMDRSDSLVLKKLGIPEIKINKSMMQLCAEKAKAGDESMIRSMEERERRERQHNEKFKRRYLKSNGGRDAEGNINSPSRKGNMLDDTLHGISSLSKGAKAADFFLMVTSPLEAIQSLGEQHVGDAVVSGIFNLMHPDVKERFAVTEHMKNVATSRQAVEARTVLESLFRIGGWTAIDAFVSETNAKGKAKYKLTSSDLRKFLADFGYTGESVPTTFMQKLGIDPKQAPAFVMNVKGALEFLEDTMLCSNMFKVHESDQFVKLSMMEMARSYVNGDEAYTSSEVEGWSDISGEEMIRQLVRTNAGREAFMTQGITSLGRKSPVDYAMRQVMAKNGLTELLIRTCFDRFPEYGMNKVLRQIPASNTLSYLGSFGIDSMARFMATINEDSPGSRAFSRVDVGSYQVGGTYYEAGKLNRRFLEGLIKNLIYDTVMAANRLTISTIYFGIMQMLGGVHRPPRPEDEYNWSEWIIGGEDDEYRTPIKWAWFMDDISGVGFPLGVAWAIAASESGEGNEMPWNWTTEAKDIAAKTFMNAIANFNDGTVVFDAIDLFNNFAAEERDAESEDGVGMWLNPGLNEKNQTTFELLGWKFLGDMTPSIVKQVLPWSRDYLWRGNDPWKRTASKVYANTNQENGVTGYTMEDAISQYRVTDVGSYNDYMLRREAQNNPVMALILDLTNRAGFFSSKNNEKTGYMFTEQPYATEADKAAKVMWDKYSLNKEDLSKDPDEAKEQCRSWAEAICQDIDANFENPTDALQKGFCMNPTARRACQEYCNWMMYEHIDEMKEIAIDELREQMGMRYLPDDIYDNTVQTYENMKDHYRMLYDNYFSGDSDIPWRLPRYKILDSDYETRYVDENGNAAVNPYVAKIANALPWFDVTPGTPEVYPYGNRPVSWPLFVPEKTLGFNNETEPYLIQRDEEGNVLNDTQGLYDMLEDIQPLTLPGMSEEARDEAQKRLQEEALEALEQMYGDRGRDAIPTIGKRGLEPVNESLPDGFKTYYDSDSASDELGFPAFDKNKSREEKKTKDLEERIDDLEDMLKNGGYGWSYGGGGGYYRGGGGYYRGGGGGGYSSAYNPRIYSNARQVNSDRAAGMRSSSPYKATSTYLRPGFYTKGSREAYKRSDL